MARTDVHPVDETLLSGYLDGELTQADRQRVRLHLENCGECRTLHGELETLRQATISTAFPAPADEQWSERPRTLLSRYTRTLGWGVLIVWLAGFTLYGAWELIRSPEDLVAKLLVFGLGSGLLLLFLSVLLDRLRDLRVDRYRGVEK